MNKLNLSKIIVAFLVGSFCSALQSQTFTTIIDPTTNNGSFETSTSGTKPDSSGALVGSTWNAFATSGASSVYDTSGNFARTGTKSLSILDTSASDYGGWYSATYQVDPLASQVISSIYYKTNGAVTGSGNIVFSLVQTNASGVRSGNGYSTVLSLTAGQDVTSWTARSFASLVSAYNLQYFQVQITTDNAFIGNIYFDDLTITNSIPASVPEPDAIIGLAFGGFALLICKKRFFETKQI